MFKNRKWILGFFSICFILLIQLFFFGDKGILAQKKLEGELLNLDKRIREIRQSNLILQEKIQDLENNPELIKKEAENLLILEKNDYIIKFTSPKNNGK